MSISSERVTDDALRALHNKTGSRWDRKEDIPRYFADGVHELVRVRPDARLTSASALSDVETLEQLSVYNVTVSWLSQSFHKALVQFVAAQCLGEHSENGRSKRLSQSSLAQFYQLLGANPNA